MRLHRIGLWAVGVGFGGAVASAPWLAAADASSDWLTTLDGLLSGTALPASSSGIDLAISYDGYTLIQEGTANAHTEAGQMGFAIAQGADSYAYAGGGFGDVAEAEGTRALAVAGGQPGDTNANFNTAIDIGNNDVPSTGAPAGAFAGNGDLGGGAGSGSHNTAIDIGDNSNGVSGGGNEGAFAGAGGLAGVSGDGNNDTAIDIGNNAGLYDGVDAVGGNNNYASEFGNMLGYDEGAFAGYGGDDNTAIADANYTADYGGVYAQLGSGNYASAVGPVNSFAVAFEGNHNVATVMDPFGTETSYADSGYGFSNDVASVLFTHGTTAAVGTDGVYDILTALGHSMGSL